MNYILGTVMVVEENGGGGGGGKGGDRQFIILTGLENLNLHDVYVHFVHTCKAFFSGGMPD